VCIGVTPIATFPDWYHSPGFAHNPTDKLECTVDRPNSCGPNSECVNVVGGIPGYDCPCKEGFTGSGFTSCTGEPLPNLLLP
jgi:hypothetical protein